MQGEKKIADVEKKRSILFTFSNEYKSLFIMHIYSMSKKCGFNTGADHVVFPRIPLHREQADIF